MSDSTINSAGTVDTVGENMSDCKIYPADTIDIYGNAWPTVGENIRNGMFGENVKAGYVNIDKGNITSTDFKINNTSSSSFYIYNTRVFFIISENVEAGGVNISFANFYNGTTIHNTQDFSKVVASIRIIYKEIV